MTTAHDQLASPGGATTLPSTTRVTGDLGADQDVVINGRFDGQITLPDHHLSIGASARVTAKIIARAVTVRGTMDGNILASERVDVHAGADVRGHVTSPSIVLADGAQFTGTVDPQRTEAAMQVARYRQKHS